ncbi:hypothetical protein COE58_11255 [Bacillus cereus]|nr:hypothetical protein COL13_11160 [Bacillus cereus]PGZ61708.1 hypothetical protein COE58_11255 [Bacillus cereus]
MKQPPFIIVVFWLMNWCISEIVDMIFLQLYCSENIRELEKGCIFCYNIRRGIFLMLYKKIY